MITRKYTNVLNPGLMLGVAEDSQAENKAGQVVCLIFQVGGVLAKIL